MLWQLLVLVLFSAVRMQSLKGSGHPCLSQPPSQKQPLLKTTALAAVDEQFRTVEAQLRTAVNLVESYQHALVDMKVSQCVGTFLFLFVFPGARSISHHSFSFLFQCVVGVCKSQGA